MVERIKRTLLLLITAFLSVNASSQGVPSSIEAITGVLSPADIAVGRYLVVFFLPDECPACAIVSDWLREDDWPNVEVVFVTDVMSMELEDWINDAPSGVTVWLDREYEWARALQVSSAPMLFLYQDGWPVNTLSWPLPGELADVKEMIRAFGDGEWGHHNVEFVGQQLETYGGMLTDGSARISELELPAILVFCRESCVVCQESLPALAEFAARTDLSIPIYVVPTTEERAGPDGLLHTYGFPLFMDSQQELTEAIGVYATPTLFVLDEAAQIVWAEVGYSNPEFTRLSAALAEIGGFD